MQVQLRADLAFLSLGRRQTFKCVRHERNRAARRGWCQPRKRLFSALRGRRAECRVRVRTLGPGAACTQAALGSQVRVPQTTGLGAGGCPGSQLVQHPPPRGRRLCQRKSQVGGLGSPSQGWKLPESAILGRGGASLGLFPVQGPGAAAGRGPGSHLRAHPPPGPTSTYRTVRRAWSSQSQRAEF